MGFFDGKQKKKNEETLRLARAIIAETNKPQNHSGNPSKVEKQVVWQCKYCGGKNTRWQSNGMPPPGLCGKNGKMTGPKGPHRWVKIMTK